MAMPYSLPDLVVGELLMACRIDILCETRKANVIVPGYEGPEKLRVADQGQLPGK